MFAKLCIAHVCLSYMLEGLPHDAWLASWDIQVVEDEAAEDTADLADSHGNMVTVGFQNWTHWNLVAWDPREEQGWTVHMRMWQKSELPSGLSAANRWFLYAESNALSGRRSIEFPNSAVASLVGPPLPRDSGRQLAARVQPRLERPVYGNQSP